MSESNSGGIKALAKARRSFGKIIKNRTVNVPGKFSYNYADLDAVYEAIMPALNDNGFVITHELKNGTLETTLEHESGWKRVSASSTGDHADPKHLGSVITYLSRYHVTGLAGVASQEDTDAHEVNPGPSGNQATMKEPLRPFPNPSPIKPKASVSQPAIKLDDPIADPIVSLLAFAQANGWTKETILGYSMKRFGKRPSQLWSEDRPNYEELFSWVKSHRPSITIGPPMGTKKLDAADEGDADLFSSGPTRMQ